MNLRFFIPILFLISGSSWAGTAVVTSATREQVVLKTEAELDHALLQYKANVLFIGHGSKGQFANVEKLKRAIDTQVSRLNSRYGEGRWGAVFGGDGFNAEKPDIGYVMRYLKDRYHVPITAIQSDVVIAWGGVDKYIDNVYYMPTDREAVLDAKGHPELDEKGLPKSRVLWGGFVNGEAKGPTKIYLGNQLIGGPNPAIKEVVAFGGGPIGKDEANYAYEHGMPVTAVQSETKNHEANGKYGSLNDWVTQHLGRDPGTEAVTLHKATPVAGGRLSRGTAKCVATKMGILAKQGGE